MSKTVNKVILLGNVGQEPVIRSAASGTGVANFTLATSSSFKDKDGKWQDQTEWHNLVAFGRTAEVVRDYVHKGTQIFVEGRIQTRSWDDKTSGEKKYKTEIVVNELVLLGGRGEPRLATHPYMSQGLDAWLDHGAGMAGTPSEEPTSQQEISDLDFFVPF